MVKKTTWVRYRFYTKADDNRPLVFNPSYPWWESGFGDDYAINVAYLPEGEPLEKYWDDAYEITEEQCDAIEFSGRFQKPDYYVPLAE